MNKRSSSANKLEFVIDGPTAPAPRTMFVAVPSGSDLFCTGFQLGDLPSAVVPENLIRADSRHEVESAHYST
jgi:hypothetical protein